MLSTRTLEHGHKRHAQAQTLNEKSYNIPDEQGIEPLTSLSWMLLSNVSFSELSDLFCVFFLHLPFTLAKVFIDLFVKHETDSMQCYFILEIVLSSTTFTDIHLTSDDL